MAKTLRFQYHHHIGSNDSCRHYQYGSCAIGTHSRTHPNDRNTKSIGRKQLVSPKNFPLQCLLPYRKGTVLGQSNRNFIIATSAVFRNHHTQSRELLCQPSASLHQLGLYIAFKSAHNHSLHLGLANSFLYNYQNISSKSHPFRLDFLGAISCCSLYLLCRTPAQEDAATIRARALVSIKALLFLYI